MKATYPVIIQEEPKGGYWVTCPSLEGCYSQGETIDEALNNIREAIELCIADLPTRSRAQHPLEASLHFVQI